MNTTMDMTAFKQSITNVIKHSKKPEAEIVNKALKDIAFRSAQFTPKANKSKVMRDIGGTGKSGKLWAIASIRANRKYGKGRWNAAQRKEIADKLKTTSAQGIGALRAGWAPAIIALGGKFRGTVRANGSVSKGTAVKATEQRLDGMISNAAVTVDKDGNPFPAENIALAKAALARAVDFVTKDRNEYAMRKMNQLLKKYSDK